MMTKPKLPGTDLSCPNPTLTDSKEDNKESIPSFKKKLRQKPTLHSSWQVKEMMEALNTAQNQAEQGRRKKIQSPKDKPSYTKTHKAKLPMLLKAMQHNLPE